MPDVVIVDDQATDRRLLAQTVRALGEDVEVAVFEDPGQALERVAEHPPDLLVADYKMPGMDGVDFLRAFRDLPGCEGVPAVIITVVRDRNLRYRALEAGAADFLTKPLDVQETQARCRNLLTLRQQQLAITHHAETLAEARRRTSRALRTLSLGNEILVSAGSEPELIRGMCRLIAERDGYLSVRVDLAAAVNGGQELPLLQRAAAEGEKARDEDPEPLPPCREVLSTGEPALRNWLRQEGETAAWVQALAAAGNGSLLVLPIRAAGRKAGTLTVRARAEGAFQAETMELLSRTADNLGYGIAALRAEEGRARAERDASYLARYDPLTGLLNRGAFLELLEGWSGKGVLMVINLDRFALVNDARGHAAGDDLLCQVVRRLQTVLRKGDILARFGDGKLGLLVSGRGEAPGSRPERDGAAKLAQRVIGAFHRPFVVGGEDHYMGVSIGITSWEAGAGEVASVLREADSAMRKAKETGGNTYHFHSGELAARQSRRLSLETRLHRAVDNEELVLFYQPIVRLEKTEIVGAEALVRWPQPDGTFIGPDEFIPLAEETGLMAPLGSWVYRTACRQARQWAQEGRSWHVSVNLSVQQLLTRDPVRDLERIREEEGAAPEHLELEVTESAIMTTPERSEGILRDLRAQGLRIAVDDFGTGYSCLNRLKGLPITTLKIDKDFVMGLPQDSQDRTIVRAIIGLAGELGVQAVAEGVESERHSHLLDRLGCQYGQGFFFGRPGPAADLVASPRKRAGEA